MKTYPTPRELADEALEALRAAPMTPDEHFEFLVQQGIIDRSGRVLVAKLFGEQADHEEPPPPPVSAPRSRNGD